MKWLLATALLAAAATHGPAQAWADRRESSVHVQVVGGVATSSDENSEGTASSPMGGVAVRASHATSNAYQYDVSLAVLATGGSDFGTGVFSPPGRPPTMGTYTVSTQVTRLDAGVTFRLGVAWIPTLRVGAGLQARRRGAPNVTTPDGEVSNEDQTGRSSELGLDIVGVASVGLDHRVNRRLIVGAAAGGSLAVPVGGESFRSLEATVHAAYYWYGWR